MSRNLVICFDGTNNQFGADKTNVVRLAQVLVRDPSQLVYYDPGVGTLPEPGVLTRMGQELRRWMSLAFGTGLTGNVEEAYSFLMDFWEPSDRVFLFGFSRGAYTARVLAGLLHALGLLPRGNSNLVPYLMRLFGGIRNSGEGDGASRFWKLCDDFRWTFARPVDGRDDRRFSTEFLGLWDTVSSVGWVWDPARYPFTARNPSVRTIRHAVSLDERRWFFRQNLFRRAGNDQNLQELWFPGVHADVGGGYPDGEGGLWRVAFEWMVAESKVAGLRINDRRLDTVLSLARTGTPWLEKNHESLTGAWWVAELFPKLPAKSDSSWRLPRFGLGRHRVVKDQTLLHQSVLLRIHDRADYSPSNLSGSFLNGVRQLKDFPANLPYVADPSTSHTREGTGY